jgi:hypothetical protein
MSDIVPIQQIPNQTLSIVLDNDRYDIDLKSTKTSTIANISRNEILLIEGVRCVGATPLIPYKYLRVGSGNFIFSTPKELIPYYPNFGIDQFLFYFSESELESLSA